MTAYQNALEVRTKADMPQEWAITQLFMGDALQDEAGRSSGAEAEALFNQSAQAYQNGFEVVTKTNLSRHLGRRSAGHGIDKPRYISF